MSRDTDAPQERGTDATMQFQIKRFKLMCRVLGATSYEAQADLIGVDRKTYYRARQGVFGTDFVAKAVGGLRRHARALAEYGLVVTLDELFPVVEGGASVEADDDEMCEAPA